MLFSYSEVGYQQNWLHDTLIEMLVADMARVNSGQTRLGWPECIPEAQRKQLSRRKGLKDRRLAYLDAYAALQIPERAAVGDAMIRQNAIPEIFSDRAPCTCLSQLPPSIQTPLTELFGFAFDLLTDLALRDQNYRQLYSGLRYKVCAFCGVEILDAPGQKREALDHYLPFARYPFAGTNFRNLPPMGTKCNSRYKGQQDIIREPSTGSRRICFDPYNGPELSLSLHDSRPFEGKRVNSVLCPDWDIKWNGGDPEKVQTWDQVFAISERYRESSLDAQFRDWVDHFCQWAAGYPKSANDTETLRDALTEYAEIVVPEGLSDSAFLKRAALLMLAHWCNKSDEGARVYEWLSDQIRERQILAA